MKKDFASFPTLFELLVLLILKISKSMPVRHSNITFKHLVIIYSDLYKVFLSFQFVYNPSLTLNKIIIYYILLSSKKTLNSYSDSLLDKMVTIKN